MKIHKILATIVLVLAISGPATAARLYEAKIEVVLSSSSPNFLLIIEDEGCYSLALATTAITWWGRDLQPSALSVQEFEEEVARYSGQITAERKNGGLRLLLLDNTRLVGMIEVSAPELSN